MKSTQRYQRFYPAGVALVALLAGVLVFKVAVDMRAVQKDASQTTQQSNAVAPAKVVTAKVTEADLLPGLIGAEMLKVAPEEAVARLYAQFNNAPLWMNAADGARRQKDLAQVLAMAVAQGIESQRLGNLLLAASERDIAPETAARADIDLTREALRLVSALRLGAVAREKLGESWIMPVETYDPVAGVADALKSKGGLREYIATLAPSDPQYKYLVGALQTYRDIVEQGGWAQISGDEEMLLDMTDPRTPQLQARLVAEGYLHGDTPADTVLLTEAIKQFQQRNGLEPDGRVGKGTLAALNVPADVRTAQIAANLERWRHTPRDRGESFIAVNTAATFLDVMVKGKSTLHLNVVSGDKRHATPIITAKITAVTFNPRWEIPPSIATKEILPKLQKNPNYLAENNIVVVGATDDPHGQNIDWSQYSARTLGMRFRQLAGDDNSLGLMKFQMSNPQNIYLHDTPSRGAFVKYERHLSHGCVRVDQPTTLAEHVLLQTPGWSEARLKEEIAKGVTRSIAVAQPLPVYISYWTAFSEDGAVNFRNDVYDRDAPLAEALAFAPRRLPAKQSVTPN